MEMDQIPERFRERAVQMVNWLNENVTVIDDVHSVEMTDFEIDWENLTGYFYLVINNKKLERPFSFNCFTITGRPEIYFPMFISPLGVPASYSAIEFPGSVKQRIEQSLAKVMPRIKAMGFHKDTGQIITTRTPKEERILDENEIENAKTMFSKENFSINVVCKV